MRIDISPYSFELHRSTHTNMKTHKRVNSMHTYKKHTLIHSNTHTHAYTHTHAHTHTYTHTYIHTHTYTHIHTHTYIHTHTHAYTHSQELSSFFKDVHSLRNVRMQEGSSALSKQVFSCEWRSWR